MQLLIGVEQRPNFVLELTDSLEKTLLRRCHSLWMLQICELAYGEIKH